MSSTPSLCTPWADAADVCAPCAEMEEATLTPWLDMASSVLFELTGRRWPGLCSETVYPSAEACMAWVRRNGHAYARPRGLPREFPLPGYPVVSITEVLIDGVAVDPARYRVDDQRWLVYMPESTIAERQGWPLTQSVKAAAGEENTWSVEYVFGSLPPSGGTEVAAALGCQLALSCDPDAEGECRLPQRVTSITRQGISMAILDPLTLFQDGLTGLPEVDLWVSAMNRGAKQRTAQIWIPGRASKVRRQASPLATVPPDVLVDGGSP
jgi:hypothetical protein